MPCVLRVLQQRMAQFVPPVAHKRCAVQVRAAHMQHHFRDPYHGFGITSPLMDVLLGTLPPKRS